MAGKGGPNSWLGSLQLTPCLVTCHTPSIVGVSWPDTREVLTPRARAITAICVLSFIFCSFGFFGSFFLVLAFFDFSLLSCHFWPFTGVKNGNQHEVMRKVGFAALIL